MAEKKKSTETEELVKSENVERRWKAKKVEKNASLKTDFETKIERIWLILPVIYAWMKD